MNSFRKTSLIFAFAGGLELFNLCPLRAHSIQTEIKNHNGKLELISEFSTGTAVQGALVRYMQNNGTPGDEIGNLNQQGKLIFDLPDIYNGEIELLVDGGPGHKDYLLLPIRSGVVQIDQIVFNIPMLTDEKSFPMRLALDFVVVVSKFFGIKGNSLLIN